MATRFTPSARDRWKGALAALTVQAVIGYALVTGLGVPIRQAAQEALTVFTVPPVEPPPPVPDPPPEERPRAPREEGEAAPPNLRADPTEVVAPPVIVPPPVPPPVIAAPVAGPGAAPSAGAAPVPGPGTGAGGVGEGRGAGARGNGTGGGGLGGEPPRLLRGRLRDSDYPAEARDAGAGGAVEVRFLVGVDGRVRECLIEQGSGSNALDNTTCRLIRERFRFRPSLDEDGEPRPAWIIERHEWVLEDVPSPRQ